MRLYVEMLLAAIIAIPETRPVNGDHSEFLQ